MNTRFCLLAALTAGLAGFSTLPACSQIAISAGIYSQSFDSLAGSGTANPWTDNTTLPGWYASKSVAPPAITAYRAGTGSDNAGAIYSFGVAGIGSVNDRALGSTSSGTPGMLAFGVRFTNDTATVQSNIFVSYTGEQWRNGGNTSSQTLTFSYRTSSDAITNSDAANASEWTNIAALDFVTPTVGATAGALDGNATSNRQTFASVLLTGVSVAPGQEIFLRWSDINDTGNDHGFGVDDLSVVFNSDSNAPPTAPVISLQPESQQAFLGGTVTFTGSATGYPLPAYQWQFNGTNLADATNTTLVLTNVTLNQGGDYVLVATNIAGVTNSQPATLTFVTNVPAEPGFSLLTYNVKGNGATDWSTNAAQVQAIARQLQYLQPDVITFNEIPFDLRYEMTNFINAFLPGYFVAISSGTDGSIVSTIASRHPITRASKWLDGIDLRSFGYSNANNALDNFTRDLFEAQIAVPGFPRPLHVFTTHLKSTAGTTYADASAKRAAEAAAITNFFATNLFTLYPYDPYTLSGDMNDGDTNALAIQTLISPATGLVLTNPKNPVTGSINTYSTTTANPGERIDFVFPDQLLFSNIRTSQVFRTDRLTPVPPNLNSNDCKVASDHLPVLVVFNNPYDKPFKLLSLVRTNLAVTLRWESVPGQPYRVETSTNLVTWRTLANNLLATGMNCTLTTNLGEAENNFRVYRLP